MEIYEGERGRTKLGRRACEEAVAVLNWKPRGLPSRNQAQPLYRRTLRPPGVPRLPPKRRGKTILPSWTHLGGTGRLSWIFEPRSTVAVARDRRFQGPDCLLPKTSADLSMANGHSGCAPDISAGRRLAPK